MPMFGDLTPQEAGQRGAESRRAKKLAEEQAAEEAFAAQAAKAPGDVLDELTGDVEQARARMGRLPQRNELGGLAVSVVQHLAVRVLNGDIEIVKAADVKAIGTFFYDVARLEAGQATSISHETRETLQAQAKAIVTQIRQQMPGAIPAAAEAADAG